MGGIGGFIPKIPLLGVGDANNYVNLSKTGIDLAGTARYKRRIRVPIFGLGKAVAAPVDTYVGNYMGYAFDINDIVYLTQGIPYRWDELTVMDANIIWAINEAYALQNAEVKWQIDWSATPKDDGEAIDAPPHTGTITTGDVNISATAYYLISSAFNSVPAANFEINNLLGIKLLRVALDDGVNPIADPIALELELIMTFNSLGEHA